MIFFFLLLIAALNSAAHSDLSARAPVHKCNWTDNKGTHFVLFEGETEEAWFYKKSIFARVMSHVNADVIAPAHLSRIEHYLGKRKFVTAIEKLKDSNQFRDAQGTDYLPLELMSFVEKRPDFRPLLLLFRPGVAQRFALVDINEDGMLSEDEISTSKSNFTPELYRTIQNGTEIPEPPYDMFDFMFLEPTTRNKFFVRSIGFLGVYTKSDLRDVLLLIIKYRECRGWNATCQPYSDDAAGVSRCSKILARDSNPYVPFNLSSLAEMMRSVFTYLPAYTIPVRCNEIPLSRTLNRENIDRIVDNALNSMNIVTTVFKDRSDAEGGSHERVIEYDGLVTVQMHDLWDNLLAGGDGTVVYTGPQCIAEYPNRRFIRVYQLPESVFEYPGADGLVNNNTENSTSTKSIDNILIVVIFCTGLCFLAAASYFVTCYVCNAKVAGTVLFCDTAPKSTCRSVIEDNHTEPARNPLCGTQAHSVIYSCPSHLATLNMASTTQDRPSVHAVTVVVSDTERSSSSTDLYGINISRAHTNTCYGESERERSVHEDIRADGLVITAESSSSIRGVNLTNDDLRMNFQS